MKYARKLTDVEAKWRFVRIQGKSRKMFPVLSFTLIFNGKKYNQTIDGNNRMWLGKIDNLQMEPELTLEIEKNNDKTYTIKQV